MIPGAVTGVNWHSPDEVEVVADGLEAIRREMGDKADADAIRQLEALIGGLQVS